MTWGELKTAFLLKLPTEFRRLSGFEIGAHIDSAFRFITIVLPADAIPEMVCVRYLDRAESGIGMYAFPAPDDFLSLEMLSYATSRDVDNEPIRQQVMIMSPAEFESFRAIGGSDLVGSMFNSVFNIYPIPTAAVAGHGKAAKIVYKRLPRPYMTTNGVLKRGVLGTLTQDIAAPHLFRADDAIIGTEDLEDFVGGSIYLGGPQMGSGVLDSFYCLRIVQCWLDNGDVVFRVAGDQPVPDPGVEAFEYSNGVVTMRPSYTSGEYIVEAEDSDYPDLAASWHPLVVDLAVASWELSNGRQQQGSLRTQSVYSQLVVYGAKLRTKPEVPERAA